MNSIKALLIAVPVLMALFSCQQWEETPQTQTQEREVQLNIGFVLSSEISTRACRPLTSVDPWQRVTDMRVYLFRSESGEDGTFKLYHPLMKNKITGVVEKQPYIYIPEFEKITGEDNEGSWKSPQDETHTYSLPSVLPDGYYRLLAVGFDDPDKSPVKLNWTEDVTEWGNAVFTNESGTPVASEVFTGYPRDNDGNVKIIHVSEDNVSFNTTIVCRRAMAGVLLYLKNIPASVTAEIGWSGNNGSPTGIITSDLLEGTTGLKVYEAALVTVGYNPLCNAVSRHWTGDFIYDNSRFKLTRLASVSINPDDADADGYHNRTFKAVGNFVMPSATHTVKENPLVADYTGGMLYPEKTSFDKSLYLCFFTKTASGYYYPLKLWPIKLVRSYIQDEELEDDCAGDLQLEGNDPYHYNLVANHLYCLGVYKDDKSADEPVDLKRELDYPQDDLTITVIGSWQWDVNIEM